MEHKRSKRSNLVRGSRGQRALPRLSTYLRVSLGVAALLSNTAAWSQNAPRLPTGGTVAAGTATIGTPSNGTLNINQSTNQAIINWNTFSVGKGGTVNFNQPSASSSTLNRVLGTTPSWIAGTINAPGTVLLVNPNGIAITKSGVVNTGSFAASTLDISNADFMAGNYKFQGNGGSAAVRNAGRINVSDGGFAALLGGQVSNSGVISARLGKVGLGAGELITLDLAGDGFLSVAVPSSQLGKLVDASGALVSNRGKIRANGGQVFLNAATASNILRDAVNVPGSIRANSVGTHNGRIVIGGGNGRVNITGRLAANGGKKANRGNGGKIEVTGAKVDLNGKITANGKSGGAITVASAGDLSVSGKVEAKGGDEQGGRIDLTSANVKLVGALIDASGKNGGGNINIGGGRKGTGPLQHADNTTIDAATVIKADARESGDGGNVVVWSDLLTTFAGTISARGGAKSGDGGQVEVSSHGTLSYAGLATLTAAHGAAGTLLLDPYDVVISSGADSATSLAGGTYTPTGTSVISNAELNAQLGLGNVTITTGLSGSPGTDAGNITVAASVSWSASTTLTLTAANNIAVNAPVTFGGTAGAGLTLNAGNALTIAAPIAVNGAGAVSLAYNTSAPTNLSFGLTTAGTFAGSVTFNAANGTALTASPGNQALSVNGASYTLLYNMTDVAGINSNLGGNYALATNIDASASIANPYTGAVVGGFSGTFEGLGDTISNLTIQTPANNNAYDVALFAENSGTMRDFALVGGQVTAGSAGFPRGPNYYYDFLIAGPNTNDGYLGSQRAGSVVGQNAGTIVNVATSTAVTGDVAVGGLAGANTGTILNSMASGAVAAGTSYQYEGYETGGLVGLNYMGTVSGSWATGAVSGYTMVGGLIGAHDDATTIGSYASGAVNGFMNVGGLIGNLEGGSLQSSYATGAVTGVGYTQTYYTGQNYITDVFNSMNVGGLIGEIYDGNYPATAHPNTEQSTSISSSYATGNVTAANGSYVGGLIGYSTNYGYTTSPTTITGVYATGAVSGSQNVGGLAGRLGFATLNGANATGAVSGNQAVGGLIGQLVSVTVNNASASGAVAGVGSGVAGVGGLIGVFNSIYPGHSGAANISASGAVTAPDGANYVGGLIGVIGTDYSYGYSDNSISNASATGSVTVGANASNVGGLIGANGITGDSTIGGVFIGYGGGFGAGGIPISSSWASGAVKAGNGAASVGGLIGSANNELAAVGNSYATGSVTVGDNAQRVGGLIGDDQLTTFGFDLNSEIYNVFATGAVTAGANASLVGGLLGLAATPEMDYIYATGAVTVGPNSNGVGGLAGGLQPGLAGSAGCCLAYEGYSTGRVSAGAGSQNVDASIGANYASEVNSGGNDGNVYGIYLYYNSDTAGVTSAVSHAATTAQFTNGTVLNAVNSQAYNGYGFSGGTNGLYPYQPQIFPTGVQAIAGTAYNANGTAATGASVSLAGLGALGQTSTGANGAYYIALPAGTLGATALETAATLNAATLTPVAATGVQSGVNLYANTLSTVTGATLASAAPTQVATIAAATTAAGTDAAALATLAGATGYGLISTGASFTLDQSVTSSGTFVAATTTPSAPLTVAAPVAAAGAVLLQTSGPLTIAAGGSVSGASPVLATTDAFVNDAGSAAVTATSGAWQIFSAAPGGDTFGGLNSNDTAIWNAPAGSAVTASGNRYVFATAPVLTVATVNDSKTYGVDATSAVASDYMITGYQAGVGGAYLGDTAATAFSGAADVTSTGSASTAVIGSYGYQLALGSLVSNAGYGFTLANTGTFTVNAAALTIAASSQTKTYGQVASLGFSATGLVTANGDMMSGVTLASAGAAASASVNGGTPYAVTASNATGTGLSNYTITYVNGALTVTPAALTITASNQTKTYGQVASLGTTAFMQTGLVTANGDAISGVTLASTGAAATANVAGSPYAITASSATGTGLSNYTVSYVNGALTVNPLAVTLSGTQVYNGTTTAAGSALAVTNLVGSDSVTVGGSGTMAAKDVGSQALASLTGLTLNNTNYTLVGGSGAVNVTPATLTYTADTASRTYGASNPALSGAVAGFVGADTQAGATTGTLGFTTTATTASNVGAYAINGSGLTAVNGNYTFVQAPANSSALMVTTATLTITASNQTKTYGTNLVLGTTGFTMSGLVTANGDTVTGVTLASLGAAAGASVNGGTPYIITASNAVGNRLSNYTISYVSGGLTVNPLAVTLSGTQVYNGTTTAAGSALAVTNLVGSDSLTIGGSGTMAAKDVGSQALASLTGLTLSNANYTLVGGSGAVNVTPAPLTYTANAASRIYGAANPALSGAVTGFVGSDTQAGATSGTLGFTTTATTASNIGSYAINGSGLSAVNGNYTFVQSANSSALTVNPATLTITASSQSKTYGQTASLGFSATGLVTANGDAINGVTLASAGAAAGASVNGGTPYAVTASNATGTGLSNYTISYVNGGLTVNPLAVTLSGTQAYNGTTTVAGPSLAVTNLVGNDSATVSGSGTMAAKDVGSQALALLTGLTLNNGNYTLVGGSGTVIVTPATLAYAADAASRTYGAANPALSGMVTGFLGSDTQANATSGTLGFTTTAATASNIGSYAINGSGLTAVNGNYTFVQAPPNNMALTVNPAPITVTAVANTKTYDGTTSAAAAPIVTAGTIYGSDSGSFTEAYTSRNAGTGLTLTPSGTINDRNGGANYAITFVASANGTISPHAVILTGTQTYDGTTNARSASLTVANVVGNDNVGLDGTAVLMSKEVGPEALTLTNGRLTGLSVSNSNYTVTGGNGTVTVTPPAVAPAGTQPSKGTADPSHFDVTVNGGTAPSNSVDITFQNPTSGPFPISFTPPTRVANTPSTDVAPASLSPGRDLATNNGLTYLPVGQFDPNQYSQFKVPDYAAQAGEATIFATIARAADPEHAADDLIDTFWNGTSGAWTPPKSAKVEKVTFSDGAGNKIDPTGNAGFPIISGSTDFVQLLKTGPVMISDGGQPAHWLLATQMTADGKGIVANDPASGKQVVLSYDASTKSVGGITGVIDANSHKFVSFAEASASTPALVGLQSFVPANFLAVSTN